MTNQDRAAKAIKFGAARGYTPEQIATLLNELNLLAPERMIPHPRPPKDVHQPAWALRDAEDDYSRSWVSALGKRIWITDSHGWGKSMTIDQAHDLVAALLSAINHQEEE
ncbi:hypothetical protein [Corynebacterium striatum]